MDISDLFSQNCESKSMKRTIRLLWPLQRIRPTIRHFCRFTLSYDFTFLAILSMAVQKDPPEFGKIRCLINPLKKCSACHKDGITDRIAAQAMITLYYKCQDQLSDENFALRLPVRVALPFFRHCWRKARQKDEEYDRSVSDMVQAQRLWSPKRRDLIRRRNLLLGIYPSTCEALSNDPSKNGSYPFGYLLGR